MAGAAPLENRWDDAHAAGLDEPGRLLYRSNLLGADKRITNYGGGNTSAKLQAKDPLTGEPVTVLWVKGSGGDLGSMKLDGFATLYLDKLERLKGLYRGIEHEDEMVGYLPHCTFDLNPRAASIDTPLHAYLPYRHVDHVHPDAVIAIAASARSEALTREIYGDEIGWLPWQRPGFDLGLKLEAIARANPHQVGCVLGGHGLFTWAEDGKACYETTLRIIQQAQDWLDANNRAAAFGGPRVEALPEDERAARRAQPAAAAARPDRRRRAQGRPCRHVAGGAGVRQFAPARGAGGAGHLLPRPLPAHQDPAAGGAGRRRRRGSSTGWSRPTARTMPATTSAAGMPTARPCATPTPSSIWCRGVGMLTFARDKATARIAAEFYVNAINVMRGAAGVDRYVGLPEQEAFDIEYWLLEEAKLQRMPKPKALAGRVALVTGGAGGIGGAVARRLLAEGACVVLTDIDAEALDEAGTGFAGSFGRDVVHTALADVTDEAAVQAALASTIERFGGIDIVVANAGLATAASLRRDHRSPTGTRTTPSWPRACSWSRARRSR